MRKLLLTRHKKSPRLSNGGNAGILLLATALFPHPHAGRGEDLLQQQSLMLDVMKI
jgi:hypothetical protein